MNETSFLNVISSINWSDIVNIFLTIILIFITYFQVVQANRQTILAKLQRIDDEFKEIVEPLYANINSNYYFRDRPPSYRIDQNHSHYWKFWESIRYNKYICPRYLRNEIESFLICLPNDLNGFDDIKDEIERNRQKENFETAKKNLFEAIKKRYTELHQEKEKLMEKST
jgi:hypothetical protein